MIPLERLHTKDTHIPNTSLWLHWSYTHIKIRHVFTVSLRPKLKSVRKMRYSQDMLSCRHIFPQVLCRYTKLQIIKFNISKIVFVISKLFLSSVCVIIFLVLPVLCFVFTYTKHWDLQWLHGQPNSSKHWNSVGRLSIYNT